jgi:hypothetical protein
MELSLPWKRLGLLLSCVLASATLLSAQQSPPSTLAGAIPQEESAEMQLQVAAQAHEATRGRQGPRRLQLLHDAVEYYRAVAFWWPQAGEERAVAAFRRGEVHRALLEAGAARGAFEETLEAANKASDFYIRALLALGSLDRQENRWGDALQRYRAAVACQEASVRYRNDAREWIVKVHLSTMAWQAAEVAAGQWLATCEGPVEEIQIVDFQIRALIGARQLRAADSAIRALLERMAVLAAAPTHEGARIQSALEQMKAPAALKLARQNGR